MFGQVIPRSFLWFVSLCAVLIIGIIGCGGDENGDDNGADDNEWVGTWSLETFDGQNYEMFWASLGSSVITNSMTFHEDGTWDSEFALEGLGTIKTMGTYSLSGSNYTVSGFDFSITAEEETGSDEDTGTWSREGNTLTITSNDGTVIVLKKK